MYIHLHNNEGLRTIYSGVTLKVDPIEVESTLKCVSEHGKVLMFLTRYIYPTIFEQFSTLNLELQHHGSQPFNHLELNSHVYYCLTNGVIG